MSPEIQAFAGGFPLLLLHAAISLLLAVAAAVLHATISGHGEVQRIREGNGAAAVSFSSVILSLGIVEAASLAAAASLIEIGLWGIASAAVALLAFRVIDLLLSGLPQRMREGEIGAAVVLAAARLAAAIVLAAALAL